MSVVPLEASFAIRSGPVQLSSPFKVNGFTARGRVVDPNGKGVAGVTVTAGLGKTVTSGADGFDLTLRPATSFTEPQPIPAWLISAHLSALIFASPKINSGRLFWRNDDPIMSDHSSLLFAL